MLLKNRRKQVKPTIKIMKKVILALIWCTVVFSPCMMTFWQGGYSLLSFAGIDDGPYLVQLIGVLYSFFLLKCHHLVIPSWVRNVVGTLVRDE